ncbi:MAG: DUF721 domain-containing protein [Thermoguttaceae bacterium]
MRKKQQSRKSVGTGPVKFNEIVPQLMTRFGFHRQIETEEILNAWQNATADILPESLQKTTTPGNIKRGVLEIIVSHPVLAQELSFYEQEIVKNLNELIPHKKIRKIKCISAL